MSYPHYQEYADYQAEQAAEAEAEAEYYAQYAEYLDDLLKDEKYDLWAFEFVGDVIYSELSKEDQNKYSEAKQKIVNKYIKKENESNENNDDLDIFGL